MGPKLKSWKYWENNQSVRDAVKMIIQGCTYQKASRTTGIRYQLIRKFHEENVVKLGLIEFYKQNPNLLDVKQNNESNEDDKCQVFTPEQDMALLQCIKQCEFLFFGITNKETRMLAYQMVVNEDMKIPEGWKNGLASAEWLIDFNKRYKFILVNVNKPDLSMHVRCKKNCNFYKYDYRNLIWEKKLVTDFYVNIETCLKKYPELVNNNRVFSLDETFVGIYTHPVKRWQIRDTDLDIITVCCVICADGTSLPPVIVKPFRESSEESRANEFIASKGRLTNSLFVEIMQYFVKCTGSSPLNPSLLIMDSDICHFSSAALQLASESGVSIVTVHPHTNVLLQPLDGEIFDSFNKNYYDKFASWKSEPASSRSPLNIGKTVDEAWTQAATPDTIANAFKRCGISPYDRDLFIDDDYKACVKYSTVCYECKDREEVRVIRYQNESDKEDGVDWNEESEALQKQAAEPEAGSSTQAGVASVENKDAEGDSASMQRQKPSPGKDLDKLKRRLIRSIARLIKEKKTEKEVWLELKEECGTNCRQLWLRMRSLTLKKLKRLLDADDRIEHVPAVARMTLTDWLLYDLVLVHEKIDVINRGSQNDSTVLENLFALVQRFEIEGRQGDDLAEAWTAATVEYNQKGHQCSPMLMQRRWFQIKELTRHKLYKFWFTYRGNMRALEQAKADSPTKLQRAISLRYPHIVTAPFPTWDERIDQKLVIMPEEFEVKMRRTVHMKPTDEAIPDVVIIEKKIDTITIDSDSDFAEEENIMQDEAQTPVIVQVKTEPLEQDTSIDITEHPVQPDKFQQAIERLEYEEDRILSHDNAVAGQPESETVMPLITNIKDAASSKEASFDNRDFQNKNAVDENDLEIVDDNSQESIVIDDDDDVSRQISDNKQILTTRPSDNHENFLTTRVVESYSNYTNAFPVGNITKATEEMFPIITSVAGGSQMQAKFETNTKFDEDLETVDDGQLNYDEQQDIILIAHETDKSPMDLAREIVSEAIFSDDDIEFADDGIEENEHNESPESIDGPENKTSNVEETGAPKFDLKLLMTPVVYTTKLDNMTVYKGKSIYETISQNELVSKIISESKPISPNTIKVEQIKADNELLQEEHSQEQTDDTQDFDDLFQNESSNDEDTFINSQRVNVTSSLLKKPKVKSYHPIQLCKNPDFNMRLKRLTMGFFSHERNRMFLRACKPMTIDLSKAFETKLVDGTMYLKPSDTAEVKMEFEKENTNEPMPVTFQPYVGPVKSLLQNPDVDRILQQELQKRMLERSKTISLPNISVVRQINKNLLMAEVAPIVAQAKNSTEITVQDLIETVVEVNKTEPKLPPEISTDMPKANIAAARPHSMVPINMPKENMNSANPKVIEATYMPKANIGAGNPSVIPTNTTKITNAEKSKEISMQQTLLTRSNPVLPMMPTKLNEDTTTEKQKKKRKPVSVQLPSWVTKAAAPQGTPEDTLLTLDTLYKVLSTFDPSSVPTPKTKNNKTSKLQKKLDENEKEDEITDLITDNSNNTNKESSTVKTPIIQKSNSNKTNKESSTVNTPIIQKSKTRKREDFCCWARMKSEKLTADSKLRVPKHRCKDRCKCCCREHLRQAEIETEIKILQKMQSRHTYLETIEQVVQQSRDNNAQVSDMDPSVATTTLQPDKPREPLQTSQSSSIACNASLVANPEKHTDITPSSKAVEAIFELESNDNNGNYGHINESAPTNNDATNSLAPKPSVRVFSAPSGCKTTSAIDIPRKGRPRGHTGLPGRSLTSVTNELGTLIPIAPLSMSVKLLQEPLMIEPLVPLDHSVEMTLTASNALKNTKEIQIKPLVTQKQIRFSRVESHNDMHGSKIPCTCRPQVAQDNISPMLVVDGIGKCKRHTLSRVSKETRIYLNRKHMTSVRRPFFVGKDKILLTNIKRPKKVTDPDLAPSEIQLQPPPAIVNPLDTIMLDLPTGVQVIILPDGNVSYTMDPGIKLTSKESEDMKMILQIVQVQVNAAGYTVPECEDTLPETTYDAEKSNKTEDQNNDSSKINESDPTTENYETRAKFAPDTDQKEPQTFERNDNQQDMAKNKDTLNDNGSVEKVTSSNVEIPIINDTTKEILNQENENTSKIRDKDSNDIPPGSNRNLLSDLMEMSGILDDDINTTLPEKATVSASIEQTEQTIVADQLASNDQPRSQSPAHQISARFNNTTYELTPVVSFSDLKYACENKGLFFKLDLNTGHIVSINVCIQRTPDSKLKLNATEVIDLTEDPKESTKETVETFGHQDLTESSDNQAKIKYLSKKYPTKPTAILQKKLDMINMFSTMRNVYKKRNKRSLLKNNVIRRRKQSFEKVSATIDIVDSDEPMEEEYLEHPSDDSDDEPLAKVAKKMRDVERSEDHQADITETLNIPDQSLSDKDEPMDGYEGVTNEPKEVLSETNEANCKPDADVRDAGNILTQEAFNDSGDSMDIDDSLDFEAAIHAVDIPINTNTKEERYNVKDKEQRSNVQEPVPTQLMLSGPMVSQPIILNDAFLNEDEDSQEDCILGF